MTTQRKDFYTMLFTIKYENIMKELYENMHANAANMHVNYENMHADAENISADAALSL